MASGLSAIGGHGPGPSPTPALAIGEIASSATSAQPNAASRRTPGRNKASMLLSLSESNLAGSFPSASVHKVVSDQTGHHQSRMSKPRIFLGSSGKQAKLLKAITRGIEDVA